MGQTAVIDVLIAPFNLASEASSLLQKSVGPLIAQNMSQDDLQGSQQILFFCNVTVAGIGLTSMPVSDARGPIDGWRWCGGQNAEVNDAPVYICRTLLMLLCIRMFKERLLSPEEEEHMLIGSIEHQTTKERRFVSRAFLERWLGIENTPFSAALQLRYPCTSLILPTTGEAAEETTVGESCGTTRYCLGCEEVFAMMSSVPAMHI